VYVKEILHELDLGNSVAEHDEALERYFVETETFRSLISDKGDIIAGDKGTGKTALQDPQAALHDAPRAAQRRGASGLQPGRQPGVPAPE
jgi:hypothetical protein